MEVEVEVEIEVEIEIEVKWCNFYTELRCLLMPIFMITNPF